MNTTSQNRARASSRVRVRENVLRFMIIVSVEDETLAWGASSWVPLTPDGLAAGDLKPVSFTSLEGAISYAESQQFKVEQP
jgi:hypothetical protein